MSTRRGAAGNSTVTSTLSVLLPTMRISASRATRSPPKSRYTGTSVMNSCGTPYCVMVPWMRYFPFAGSACNALFSLGMSVPWTHWSKK